MPLHAIVDSNLSLYCILMIYGDCTPRYRDRLSSPVAHLVGRVRITCARPANHPTAVGPGPCWLRSRYREVDFLIEAGH